MGTDENFPEINGPASSESFSQSGLEIGSKAGGSYFGGGATEPPGINSGTSTR